MAGEVHEFSGSCFFWGGGGWVLKILKFPKMLALLVVNGRYGMVFYRYDSFVHGFVRCFFFKRRDQSPWLIVFAYYIYVFYLSNK